MSERRFQVIEDWKVVYPNPIKLKKSDKVRIEKREADPEWAGWVYCLDSRGIGGWVSETYLHITDSEAIVIKDYDATELAVKTGQVIFAQYEEFGWIWAMDEKQREGWVPLRNLKEISNH